MRQQVAVGGAAFGRTVRRALSQFENPRAAKDIRPAGAVQEGGLHVRGDPLLGGAAPGHDGQPHGDIRGAHGDDSVHHSARPIRSRGIWHENCAFSRRAGFHLIAEGFDEGRLR